MIDIASYLDSMGGKASAGVNWVIDCPFCSRKFHLYCTVEESQDWDGKPKPPGVWICFGCGEKSRDFAHLLAKFEGCSFSEARATIGKWKLGGVKLRPPTKQRVQTTVTEEQWLPVEYEPVTEVWPKYLTRRDISMETAKLFKLGVCRRHDKCPECRPYSCKRNMAHRIILPIECPAGRSYQARAIDAKMEPRYLSGDNSGQLLFGWSTIEDSDFAGIVEGPFDAMKVVQAGLPCVALMGKDIRETQLAMLRMRRRKYIIALDPMDKDPKAIDSACKLGEILGGDVVIGLHTDPGDATSSQILRAFSDAVPPLRAMEMAGHQRRASLLDRFTSR